MIASMTAFESNDLQGSLWKARWEIKSVNHRYLELSFKLPEAFREVEFSLREMAKQYLQRGKVDCFLSLDATESFNQPFNVNLPYLNQLAKSAELVGKAFHKESSFNLGSFSVFELLRWPGVLTEERNTLSPDVIEKVIQGFETTLQKLVKARQNEGEKLKSIIMMRFDEMLVLVGEIQQRFAWMLKHRQQKMREKINELKVEVNQERLEQELLYLATKLDITEEIERLIIHINSGKANLNQNKSNGRALDFLSQELNREVNTLASKSQDPEISRMAIELKVLIEKIREQVQNIE